MDTREQTVAKLTDESEKLQYDKEDGKRIYKASEGVTQSFVALLSSLADFRDESMKEVHEDAAADMKAARMALVEAYAEALVHLHKIGAVFRISGEAFDRKIKHLSGPEEAPLVMSDL